MRFPDKMQQNFRNSEMDYLVTLKRKQFIEDAQVVRLSGLHLGTPGDAILWLRQTIFQVNDIWLTWILGG